MAAGGVCLCLAATSPSLSFNARALLPPSIVSSSCRQYVYCVAYSDRVERKDARRIGRGRTDLEWMERRGAF